MAHQIFTWQFTVLETHLDTFGHMNNATYLQLFEQARWDFIHSRGYGLKKIIETQVGPTLLEANIKYKRELRLREVITVESQTLEYGGKIGKVFQKMINQKNELCATAEFTVGLFDMKTRRLVSATPDWLHAIGVTNT